MKVEEGQSADSFGITHVRPAAITATGTWERDGVEDEKYPLPSESEERRHWSLWWKRKTLKQPAQGHMLSWLELKEELIEADRASLGIQGGD